MSSRDPGVFHLVSSTGQLGLWSPAQASQRNRGGGGGECFARALSGSDGLAMLPLPFLTLPPALDLLSGDHGATRGGTRNWGSAV